MVAHGNSLPFNGKLFVTVLFGVQPVAGNFPVFQKLAGFVFDIDHGG